MNIKWMYEDATLSFMVSEVPTDRVMYMTFIFSMCKAFHYNEYKDYFILSGTVNMAKEFIFST